MLTICLHNSFMPFWGDPRSGVHISTSQSVAQWYHITPESERHECGISINGFSITEELSGESPRAPRLVYNDDDNKNNNNNNSWANAKRFINKYAIILLHVCLSKLCEVRNWNTLWKIKAKNLIVINHADSTTGEGRAGKRRSDPDNVSQFDSQFRLLSTLIYPSKIADRQARQ